MHRGHSVELLGASAGRPRDHSRRRRLRQLPFHKGSSDERANPVPVDSWVHPKRERASLLARLAGTAPLGRLAASPGGAMMSWSSKGWSAMHHWQALWSRHRRALQRGTYPAVFGLILLAFGMLLMAGLAISGVVTGISERHWEIAAVSAGGGGTALLVFGFFFFSIYSNSPLRMELGGLSARVSLTPITAPRGANVTYNVELDQASRASRVFVGLICTELRHERSHAFGGGPEGLSAQTIDSARRSVVFCTWSKLGASGEGGSFRIPADAPFSYEGEYLSLRWTVVASAGRRVGPAQRAEAELRVLP
jgi:hypothetical protein